MQDRRIGESTLIGGDGECRPTRGLREGDRDTGDRPRRAGRGRYRGAGGQWGEEGALERPTKKPKTRSARPPRTRKPGELRRDRGRVGVIRRLI